MKKFLINQRGNIKDIRDSLKFGLPEIQDLRLAIANEKENKNRDTVLKLLEIALKKQLKTVAQ
jgi:hypothetical protein